MGRWPTPDVRFASLFKKRTSDEFLNVHEDPGVWVEGDRRGLDIGRELELTCRRGQLNLFDS